MNSDIRVAVNFLDHPKFIKLERRLGWPGIKSLMRLWCWSAQYRPDGVLENMTCEDIEIAAQWNNDSLTFVETLVELRLIDKNNDTFSIHGWLDYNGFAASAPDRSDKSRFSRLAKTHPDVYKKLKESGKNSITSEEYHRLTTLQRSVKGSLTKRSTFSLSPSPSPSPSPLPSPSHTKKTPQTPQGANGDFSAFWDAYPKKKAKQAALKTWTNLSKKKALPDIGVILEAIQRQRSTQDWQKDGGQFIPHPATWLNAGQWDDKIECQINDTPACTPKVFSSGEDLYR